MYRWTNLHFHQGAMTLYAVGLLELSNLRVSHRIPRRRAQNDLERVPVLLSLTISFASETFLLRSAPITRTCSDQARPFGTGETFYIILETIGNVCPIASWASNVRLSRVNSDKIAGGN
jgi:hypothetical protein